jgi:hypothetical protein
MHGLYALYERRAVTTKAAVYIGNHSPNARAIPVIGTFFTEEMRLHRCLSDGIGGGYTRFPRRSVCLPSIDEIRLLGAPSCPTAIQHIH